MILKIWKSWEIVFGRHLMFRGEAGMQGRGKLAWSGEEGG